MFTSEFRRNVLAGLVELPEFVRFPVDVDTVSFNLPTTKLQLSSRIAESSRRLFISDVPSARRESEPKRQSLLAEYDRQRTVMTKDMLSKHNALQPAGDAGGDTMAGLSASLGPTILAIWRSINTWNAITDVFSCNSSVRTTSSPLIFKWTGIIYGSYYRGSTGVPDIDYEWSPCWRHETLMLYINLALALSHYRPIAGFTAEGELEAQFRAAMSAIDVADDTQKKWRSINVPSTIKHLTTPNSDGRPVEVRYIKLFRDLVKARYLERRAHELHRTSRALIAADPDTGSSDDGIAKNYTTLASVCYTLHLVYSDISSGLHRACQNTRMPRLDESSAAFARGSEEFFQASHIYLSYVRISHDEPASLETRRNRHTTTWHVLMGLMTRCGRSERSGRITQYIQKLESVMLMMDTPRPKSGYESSILAMSAPPQIDMSSIAIDKATDNDSHKIIALVARKIEASVSTATSQTPPPPQQLP